MYFESRRIVHIPLHTIICNSLMVRAGELILQVSYGFMIDKLLNWVYSRFRPSLDMKVLLEGALIALIMVTQSCKLYIIDKIFDDLL